MDGRAVRWEDACVRARVGRWMDGRTDRWMDGFQVGDRKIGMEIGIRICEMPS